ncbi:MULTISPECIES: GTP-binding protein [Terrabacteria group]|uniref:CobW family GTP-binding protein n=1 Tax=Bacillati TaxID=1783272 RepID=UPI001C6F2F8E|nr:MULTISPECIES: CobW family GTP-binding protein [Terrabacteria group]MBW9212865.1 GTP-binding protein [Trueperella sp. zg.1013]
MIKVDLISGFLGAGKTTLIQKLLAEVYKDKKVVLIENEFGEIGIDGSFLKEAGIVVNEINSGCICCTLQGDFRLALMKVVEEYHPDVLLIEPSGVGKLSDILSLVASVEDLEVHTQSTVVDADRALMYHKNFGEFFNDQIQNANCVILSRTQEIEQEKLEAVLNMIHELNKDVRVVTTPWSDISGEDLYDAMIHSKTPVSFNRFWLEEHHHEHKHNHDHECGCHHDHEHEHECCHHHEHNEKQEAIEKANEGLSEGNRIHIGAKEEQHHHHHNGLDADEVFDTIGIETIQRYSKSELDEVLARLPETILRAKGIVQDHKGNWFFFDYVPGSTDIREGKPAYTGLVTVIGTNVDVEKMKEIFKVH